jgi:hypothetical protein
LIGSVSAENELGFATLYDIDITVQNNITGFVFPADLEEGHLQLI